MGTEPDEDRSPVGILAKIRANPTGRLLLRIAVAISGALVIALGIILLPFPGPGWAIVIFGLAIWTTAFTWTKKRLQFTKQQAQPWSHWIARRSWPTRSLRGLAGLL